MTARIPAEASGGTIKDPRLITPDLLRAWPLPATSGTKYSRGQVVVVGGAARTPGAVLLSGEAALRVGAGRLSLAVADTVATALAVAFPESGVYGLAADDSGSVSGDGAGEVLSDELGDADALLVGPGLDDAEGTARVLDELVSAAPAKLPIVLDAYGSTVLPDLKPALLRRLRGRTLVKANTVELARLVGTDTVEHDDVGDAASEVSEKYGVLVASSGWVVAGQAAWLSSTGDTGLGTSGSGDVLAGEMAGLLSRGAGPEQAAAWATYVHAAAGDALAARFGRVGFLAREILPELPTVLAALRGD